MRKAFEAAQSFFGGTVFVAALDVTIHAQGVGPIGFPAEKVEIVFGDEAFRDFGARVIEFVGAVTGFAEEHEAAFASVTEKAIEVAAIAGKWVRKFLNGLESVVGGDHKSLAAAKESSRECSIFEGGENADCLVG
jgi:uncharacterized protein YbjQ (UPF0145 family)